MRATAEWISCEARAATAPTRAPAEHATPAPHAHGAWAYTRATGLRPRMPGDGGEPLAEPIVAIFDELWRSCELPAPELLAEVVEADAVSTMRWVGVTVPRYWRSKVRAFEVRHGDEIGVRYLVSGCKRVGPQLQYMVTLERELSPALMSAIEPVVPALLYDVDGAPRDEDRRAVTFIEIRLDGSGIVTVFKEQGGVVRGIEPLEPDSAPMRIEHASIGEAIAKHGLELAKIALVERRDSSMSLIDILHHEVDMRGIELRYLETRDDGLAFATSRSQFSGVDTFIELRDILRWGSGGF